MLSFLTGTFDVANPRKGKGPGATAKEIIDHAVERLDETKDQPLLQANLRSDLDGLLRRVQRNLLEDPTYGVLAPVTHIAGQLAAALPAPTPLPRTVLGPLQDPF